MDSDDARTNLDALVTRSGEGFAALSRMLGRNDAYLQQFVRRGSPRRLAEGDRKRLADYLGVDEAVLGGTASPVAAETLAVRRIDAVASAGPGGLIEQERELGDARFDRRFFASLGVRADRVSMLRAEGDSMLPLIEAGDEILVDEADRAVTARAGIFVLRLDGALMVKSLTRAGNHLRIESRNPAYPPVSVPDAAAEIVGRVVWLSRALR